jgi:hypothetical protein
MGEAVGKAAYAALHEKGGAGITKDTKLAATEYALGCTSFDPQKTGTPEKSCRKAAALLRTQKRNDELRRVLSSLCGGFRDKKACGEAKKLGPSGPPKKGPPPPPPGAKGSPPPPPGKGPPPPPPPPPMKK